MAVRVRSRSVGFITGTQIQIIDGSNNVLGPFSLIGSQRAAPVEVLSGITKLTDAGGNVGEFANVGGEKALKVDVIATVGGGGGGTAMTDGGTFTETATQFTPAGGEYNTSPAVLTTGKGYALRLNAKRHTLVQLADSSDNELLGQQTMARSVPVALSSNHSNVPTNVAQLAGTATSVNSGTKDNGTQRVVLATDQPALTNPLDFNLKQVGGAAYALGPALIAAAIPVQLSEEDFLAQALGNAGVLTSTVKSGSGWGVAVTGIGTLTLSFEYTQDGTNWNAAKAFPVGGGAAVTSTTANGNWYIPDFSYKAVRVRVSAFTSGTATTSLIAKQGSSPVLNLGQRVMADSLPVVLPSDQGAIPVSQSGTWNIATVTSLTQMNGAAIAMNTGVRAAGVQRVTICTDDVVPASQSGTWTVQPGNTANTTPWLAKLHDGTTAFKVLAASTAAVATDPAVVVGISPNNSVAVTQATAANLKATVIAAGDTANAASDAGNPVKIGAFAVNANRTRVTNTQRSDLISDLAGRLLITPNQCRELVAFQNTTITSSVSETTIVTAGAAGVFNDLIALYITNTSATALKVTLKDATGGTTRGTFGIAANGGICIQPSTPMPQATAANNWTLTCGTSVAGIEVTALYAKNT